MENLDPYFDKAKKQIEIVPLSDISKIISTNKKRQIQEYTILTGLFQSNRLAYTVTGIISILFVSIAAVFFFNQKASTNKVYIPERQQRIFKLVQSVEARPNSQIALSQFGYSGQGDLSVIPIHLRTKFELSAEQLKLLGITFDDQLIKYEGNIRDKGYVSFSVQKTNSVSVSVNQYEKEGVKHFTFYPWFLSDENGVQSVRYRFDNEDSLKMTNSFFSSVIDQLIPIQVTRPGFFKVIFWYSQTPELMSILESATVISKPTRNSVNTDIAQNTIDIRIFPTITKGPLHLTASVLKDQTLELTILNTSGKIVLIPVQKQLVKKGEYTYEADLSEFDRGLYFLRIQSNPGFVTIHRIFKE